MVAKQEASLFRSEDMAFIKLYVEKDAARDLVHELGRVGKVEFLDLNQTTSAFHRAFASEIKRCDEIQRKFRVFREILDSSHVAVSPHLQETAPSLVDVEITATEQEKELLEINRHYEDLSRFLNEREEQLAILKKCSEIHSFTPTLPDTETGQTEPLAAAEESVRDFGVKVRFIAGCVSGDKMEAFERITFRATRGNSLLTYREIPQELVDPKTGKPQKKVVFMIFFAGAVVARKITKIAESLGASIYPVPDREVERQRLVRELELEIKERTTVLEQTKLSRLALLHNIAATLYTFEQTISHEVAVFHTLNMFEGKTDRKAMEAEGWCPLTAIPDIKEAIARVGKNVPRPILSITAHPDVEPPTHFETNKLTVGFQAIIDAYGIANYKEFNPTPFTVITFPFLFAVMFGDVGHGFLMLLFALYLVAYENYYIKNPPGEIFAICFGGRYVILLMAIFSIYTGLLYNDIFALSANLFDSSYVPICDEFGDHGCEKYHFANYFLKCEKDVCGHIFDNTSRIYPFGLDPIWKQSENELAFTNSLKMKMSIVFGVIQMEYGLLLSGLNYIHYADWISFLHQFIPQVLFLTSVFGYMVITIFTKWGTYYENTHCAPSILQTFIDMFLEFGAVHSEEKCQDFATFFPNQSMLERCLIVIAFICVPWMLLTKPLLMKQKHSQRALVYQKADRSDGEDEFHAPTQSHGHGHGGHEFDFAEEMVHQIIHTIEFVLGAVSNTASYLRLWALSLAHAQLSIVFWEKVMVENMSGGWPTVLIAFAVWTCCTLAVLMVMESLSAFLHALRLHWVEFQGKFYHGAGRKFVPFRFQDQVLVE
eukprot:c8758_g1_i1.p1 GENE.c8758_g1_i1~~c8758_g1_i1.p1  ORF type:complete len:827 (-),score=137.71 c8758_g1_i1:63-2543(-)